MPLSPSFTTGHPYHAMPRSRGDSLNEGENIPLQKIMSNQSTGARQASHTFTPLPGTGDLKTEKTGRSFRRGIRKKGTGEQKKSEEGALGLMGRIYKRIFNFSLVTRYFIYVLPLGLLIAVPIVVGATLAKGTKIGGVSIVWFFTWIEIVWLSLWVSKLVAHFLPIVFQFVVGVISSKIRKYALLIRALELPLSFIGWALVSLLTFTPLMLHNPTTRAEAKASGTTVTMQEWQSVLRQILAATLVNTVVYFGLCLLIQIISISYHNRQFHFKIKDNKRQVYLLSLLYDASRQTFPEYCSTFIAEDNIINDSLNLAKYGKQGHTHGRGLSGSVTPMRLLQNVGRFGDNVTSAVGRVAQEITGGKKVFDSNSSAAIVAEALEKRAACEALAKRIWMSFVMEGSESLYLDDLIDVLGEGARDNAEECFSFLDRDGNGDVSLDEMILMVSELGRSRKSIASSMHDVDQAIKVLKGLLFFVVFIVWIMVYVAFLNKNFTTTLATAGTAILSLSFVFSVTAQEVLGSCIFLFVKHPFDIGDRVDLNSGTDQLTVEHISLLYTVFRRVNSAKTVQIPNIVLNSVWVENITRSNAMREQIQIFCHFDTSIEDIEALRQQMSSFVTDPANSRDFQPEIDIDVIGLADMSKLELRIECKHKSNWANESVRASRRSKFMCALVLAIRKVPIYGPGAGGPILGSIDQPTYSVAVSAPDAEEYRQSFAATKEAKRLIPTKKPEPAQDDARSNTSGVEASQEVRAMQALNQRNPALDPSRDDAWLARDNSSDATLAEERRSIEEVRTMLHRAGTRGRRQPNQLSPVVEPYSQQISTPQSYPTVPPSNTQYAYPPAGLSNLSTPQAYQIPIVPGNAFNQNAQLENTNLQRRGTASSQMFSAFPSSPPPRRGPSVGHRSPAYARKRSSEDDLQE